MQLFKLQHRADSRDIRVAVPQTGAFESRPKRLQPHRCISPQECHFFNKNRHLPIPLARSCIPCNSPLAPSLPRNSQRSSVPVRTTRCRSYRPGRQGHALRAEAVAEAQLGVPRPAKEIMRISPRACRRSLQVSAPRVLALNVTLWFVEVASVWHGCCLT